VPRQLGNVPVAGPSSLDKVPVGRESWMSSPRCSTHGKVTKHDPQDLEVTSLRHRLWRVRNSLVHPPKRIEEPEWPHRDELLEAWQLATWYLELAVLRLLGYRGEYVSRLRLEGWVVDIEVVPWSTSRNHG
jgi:hypothetical protein